MIDPDESCAVVRDDGGELAADLYLPPGQEPRPLVLYLHGGALIMGSRRGVPQPLLADWLDEGYAVLSVEYRLAPEAKLPDILRDMQAAFRWAREQGPARYRLDPARVAAAGNSAGGYLSLLAGCRVDPPPAAIVSFYGYGDIVGPWLIRPDPFYCTQPPISRQAALAAVRTAPIVDDEGDERRGSFYLYCRQRGEWPKAVLGADPDADAAAFAPFCPERQVASGYPPTLLLHGDRDTDVPYARSVDMAAALARAGIPHELFTLRGLGHGFCGIEGDPQVDAARAAARAFLRRYLA